MILADKIINERKKNGWSQEELAQQLSVSRQSVSKWEGAQAVPDLQKIIAMADIFGVSTDYLLKDEIEPDENPIVPVTNVEVVSTTDTYKVTLEDANEYLNVSRLNAPKVANGVSLCILSPALLILLAGLTEMPGTIISDTVAIAVGVITLLALVSIAVYIFIITGAKINRFEFIEKEIVETAYGVDGLVQERMRAMESRKTSYTAIGVILCIVCSMPLIISACLSMANFIIVAMVSVLLIIVSIAVNLFVRVNIEWGSCEQILQVGEYTVSAKNANKKVEKVSGIYWGVALAIYLGWSFISQKWEFTWIIWPVAGVLFGAVTCLIRAISKD